MFANIFQFKCLNFHQCGIISFFSLASREYSSILCDAAALLPRAKDISYGAYFFSQTLYYITYCAGDLSTKMVNVTRGRKKKKI